MRRDVLDLPPAPLSVYRRSCIVMLRRYFRMSIELGRLPAILGREFFRSRSDTIRDAWFEDAVIYVHDVERCIDQLHHFDRQVIARVIFQEYTHEDAARLLQCSDRQVRKRLAIALDVLSQLFLDRHLLRVIATAPPSEDVDISAAVEPLSRASIPPARAGEGGEWRELPVEISCQAPWTSQFHASC